MDQNYLSKSLLFVSVYLLFAPYIIAQNPENESQKTLLFGASYIGDNMVNLSGGMKTGYAYLGLVNIRISLNTENAGLWKGGLLYVNGANTHGSMPSSDYLGDFQVASNIEAGNHTYIQELWYKQILRKFEFTVGLQDLNVEFVNTEFGSNYLNSSFGTLPVISGNIPAPIFPLTSLGITAKWNITDRTSWLAAVYDGSPTDFDYNPFNLKWKFKANEGLLFISEIQRKIKINDQTGNYKLGMYLHNHMNEGGDPADSLNQSISGVFIHADQNVFETARNHVGVFLQAGFSPSKNSYNKFYLGTGINLTGFLSRSKNEILGLAVAHAQFAENAGSETVLEITWRKQIFDYLSIQPDIQYILNPSGKQGNLNNCLAVFLRFTLSFN